MSDYRKSTAWKAAHELVVAVYENTEKMPRAEIYGLQAQMRRAAVSAASNLVEGLSRDTSYSELHRFCQMAAGSAGEVEYQATLSHELGFVTDSELAAIHEHVDRCQEKLHGFRRWLKKQIAQPFEPPADPGVQ